MGRGVKETRKLLVGNRKSLFSGEQHLEVGGVVLSEMLAEVEEGDSIYTVAWRSPGQHGQASASPGSYSREAGAKAQVTTAPLCPSSPLFLGLLDTFANPQRQPFSSSGEGAGPFWHHLVSH